MLQAIRSQFPVRLPRHLLLSAALVVLSLVSPAMSSVAYAASQTIPCAADNQGNPM
jgi:hypothetical protein